MAFAGSEFTSGILAEGSRTTARLTSEGIDGPRGIARAAELLRGGRLVAFPTETVYGLGADAFDPSAVESIFAAKSRPAWDPLIVHVDSPEMVARIATVPEGHHGRLVRDLMAAFWPGALTLLLPRTAGIPDAVTAGRPLVAVRTPAHPVALELIRQAATPIAAPSANLFGRPSPTTAAHVLQDLDGRIDAVLDGGATRIGLESTVVGPDPDDEYSMIIYRPGGVTLGMLEASCGAGVFARFQPAQTDAPESLPSPGVGLKHYAPRARLVLVPVGAKSGRPAELALIEAIDAAAGEDRNIGVMLPDGWDASYATAVFRWGPWRDAEILSRLLFAGLRMLDKRGVRVIVCPVPEPGGLRDAIRDRLEKAARPG